MLYKIIGRNGKRKATKLNESRFQCNTSSASEQSQVASSLVFDINEESLVTQSSPLPELHLSNPNEEWFPQDLFRSRNGSPIPSPRHTRVATVAQNASTQGTRTNPSPVPSLSHSESSSSGLPFRKKSIPAPIMIPDHALPNIQIGQSAAPSGAFLSKTSRPNPNGPSVNPPSPSISENLSSISGTTLARALIASSFVLSNENRSSRHRSGIARQDSATLPRGSFFLSDSRSSSPIPPVPPVPPILASSSPDLNRSAAIQSGTSTESEYPMTDSYITTPETSGSSVVPQHREREIRSLPVPTSTKGSSPTVPATKTQQKVGHVLARSRVQKDDIIEVPKTAVEVSLPATSRQSSQEDSVALGSDEYCLDEFDFLPPESLALVATPESDSSASYISHRRGDTSHGQWRRGAGGSIHVQNNAKGGSLTDSTSASHQIRGIPSATTSEHDFGELHHYDLISPERSESLSSASAGYQTFPETPVVFSPPWSSSGFSFSAKSDSQMTRRRISVKSVRRGSGRVHSRATRRQMGNNYGGNASQSSFLSNQKPPSLKGVESNLLPSMPVIDDASDPDDVIQPSKTNTAESQQAAGPSSGVRLHPLARISSSSSCLQEEEALLALAQHSPSTPSIVLGIDPSLDSTTGRVSVSQSANSPTLIPLPESTDAPPSVSPGLPETSSSTSQSPPSKSPLSCPSSRRGSFLPSTSLSPPLNERLSCSPIVPVSSSFVPNSLNSPSSSPSPSFIPPPPYHTVVTERTTHHPRSTSTPSLSRKPSTDPVCSRQTSNSSLASGSARPRMRSRPPLPIGPRKPGGPGQSLGSIFPGTRGQSASASSLASSDPTVSPGFSWRKLHAAALKPPPKFQTPPPKWRGLTLEAAQWTFTSSQLQETVSQAIQQSSEGSSLRFIRPEILDGEIADEMHRLELQLMDVKSQHKALGRKRWMLMGALAGHVEGVEMSDATTAARTLEELAEVLSALDLLTDKMHDILLQMGQIRHLRDVHTTSALALAVRKINGVFVRQMAEKERLQERVDTLATERDEAWKHAVDIAQDYDTLNDRVTENPCACVGDVTKDLADAQSVTTSSRRSTRILAVRKSSVRQSQAGLRSRSRHRTGSTNGRPASLVLDDCIPPVPRLPVNPTMSGSSALPTTGISYGSLYDTSAATPSTSLALAQAQREVYNMLGLSAPPSIASSRCRTLSGPALSLSSASVSASCSPLAGTRPMSDTLDRDGRAVRDRRMRSRQECRRATKSVILEDRFNHVRPLAIVQRC